ncbi:MAG: HPF/RaiA family ribosome-associated protein [Betaproteobacteria bacterium]
MRFTQITFRHMAHSASLGERIRDLSGRLEERFPKIERCRAAVEEFRTAEKAHQFKVTVDVLAAGRTLVASAHGGDIEIVLREVFAELDRKVPDFLARRLPA